MLVNQDLPYVFISVQRVLSKGARVTQAALILGLGQREAWLQALEILAKAHIQAAHVSLSTFSMMGM